MILGIVASVLKVTQKNEQQWICRQWQNKHVFYDARMYKNVITTYKSMYEKMKWNDMFLFEYGLALNRCKYYNKSNIIMYELSKRNADIMPLIIISDNYKALHKFKSCEASLLKAIHRLPDRIYTYYKLAILYSEKEHRDIKKLKKTFWNAQNNSNHISSPATTQMQLRLKELYDLYK